MLKCRDVVHILSSEERPTWRRRVEIRFHLFICHHCAKYARQLEALRIGIRQLVAGKSAEPTEDEIRELEKKIMKRIDPN